MIFCLHKNNRMTFAGDAILTLWKVDSFLAMRVTVEHVIRSALKIQEKYGEWITSVGIKLRVKIGTNYRGTNLLRFFSAFITIYMDKYLFCPEVSLICRYDFKCVYKTFSQGLKLKR